MTLQERQPLVSEILAWPLNDRGDLAATLLASFDSGQDDDAEAAWAEEIRKRVDDVQAGRAKMIPWREARKQILADEDGGY